MRSNTYLLFNGNCQEAFAFYAKVLGGKITAMMPHGGTSAESHVPAEWRDKIIHACIDLGQDLLMASDAPPGRYEKPGGFSVSLQYKDQKEAERVFNALADNGTVTMPFQKTFWSPGFGMLTDRYGTPWMVNVDLPL